MEDGFGRRSVLPVGTRGREIGEAVVGGLLQS